MALQNDELIALALGELREALPAARAAKVAARVGRPRAARDVFARAGPAEAPGDAHGRRGPGPRRRLDRDRPARYDRRRRHQRPPRGRGHLMNSVVVHYQEIALKGRNRPWFIARLVRNLKTATSDLDVTARRHDDGTHRDHARLGRTRGSRWPSGCATCSASRTSRARRSCRSTSTASRTAILDDLGDLRRVHVPRVGAPRRQAVSADVAADRARGRRPHQGGEGLARRSRRSGADDPRRAADRRGVLLLRQGAGPGGLPTGIERPRGVPAVGRHRFAGGGATG